MLQHIKILGILFLVRGILSTALGLILFTIFRSGAIIFGDYRVQTIVSIVVTVIAIIALVRGIPDIICGAGLLAQRKWSRVFGIIMAVISIFEVPIGTALGIYGLWVLFKPETQQLLTT
jgi:hypothetical protein